MLRVSTDLDLTGAVRYHYGKFPPVLTDFRALIHPLSRASGALARYDQMLKGMHSSDILLAPLRSQEAVISSRMEGTISTLDEVLRYAAEQEGGEEERPDRQHGSEAMEVWLYSRAMLMAQEHIKNGGPLSNWLIRSAHRVLLDFGRGSHLSPGEFKTEQNYLADKGRREVMFIPISPERLGEGLDDLFTFINDDGCEILIRTAIAHLEFEALHPFRDGNGRIGRMLIPLMLWRSHAITDPHFYISRFFETNRDEYIDRMRAVSASDAWTDWIVFFLRAVEDQAQANLRKAEQIRALYENMKERFRDILSSQWSTTALDFMFTRPVFRNNVFTGKSNIPPATAHRFIRNLCAAGLLQTLAPAAGRRPALYAFEPLISLVR